MVNIFKDRVRIQEKTITQGALGQTVVWKPVETRYARVVLLDASARAIYQQLHSEVSHKVIFRDGVTLSMGNHRILWKDKTLEPIEPPQEVGNEIVIAVREV